MPTDAPISPDRVTLRPVEDADLPIFFTFEQDSEAIHMAAFTAEDPADRAAFDAHWARIRGNEAIILRTILVTAGRRIAGPLRDVDQPQVSYWLGRHSGAVASRNRRPAAFLRIVTLRPLMPARSRQSWLDPGLEKNGFVIVGKNRGFANGRGAEVEEVILRTNERHGVVFRARAAPDYNRRTWLFSLTADR